MTRYDLLIVGNGYDLASGYQTSYSAFLNSLMMSQNQNMLFHFFVHAYRENYIQNDQWNGFEKLLCNYLQFLNYLFTNSDNVDRYFSPAEEDYDGVKRYRYFQIHIKDLLKTPDSFINVLRLINPVRELCFYRDSTFRTPYSNFSDDMDRGELFIRTFVNVEAINKNDDYVLDFLLQKVDAMVKGLENSLKNYINNQTSIQKEPVSLLKDSEIKRIISFNYSKTAQNAFSLNDECVAYIHGNISKEIVLGVEPFMIKEQTFDESSLFKRFFKRFRRILKDCNKRYNEKIINYLNSESIIGIYGHSLDLADKSILKPIFESKYKKYDIYCYEELDVVKTKLVNLIGLDLYDELEKDNKINLIPILNHQ